VLSEKTIFESHNCRFAYLLLVHGKKRPRALARLRLEPVSSNVMDGAENIRSLETRQATGCASEKGVRQDLIVFIPTSLEVGS
jgi:hypothetical protein